MFQAFLFGIAFLDYTFYKKGGSYDFFSIIKEYGW